MPNSTATYHTTPLTHHSHRNSSYVSEKEFTPFLIQNTAFRWFKINFGTLSHHCDKPTKRLFRIFGSPESTTKRLFRIFGSPESTTKRLFRFSGVPKARPNVCLRFSGLPKVRPNVCLGFSGLPKVQPSHLFGTFYISNSIKLKLLTI